MKGLSFLLPLFGGDTSLSDNMPAAEATAPQAGAGQAASRDDHRHPRLTSSHSGLVIGAAGTQTVAFTRTFAAKPAISIIAVQASASTPVMFEVVSFSQDGNGQYNGCVVKAYKGAVVTVGVLGIQVNAFSASAVGVEFTLIAVQTS